MRWQRSYLVHYVGVGWSGGGVLTCGRGAWSRADERYCIDRSAPLSYVTPCCPELSSQIVLVSVAFHSSQTTNTTGRPVRPYWIGFSVDTIRSNSISSMMHIVPMRFYKMTFLPAILTLVLDTTLITPSPSPFPIFWMVVYSPTNSLILFPWFGSICPMYVSILFQHPWLRVLFI